MRYTLLLFASLALGAQDSRVTRLLDEKLNVAERNDACVALRGDRSSATVAAMRRALESPPVRTCAVRNLREAGAIEELKSAFSGDDPEIRAVAARELGALALPEMMAPLAQNARDPNLTVATGAFQGLLAYSDRPVLPYLLDLAQAGGLVGTMALSHAIQFHDPSVLPVARRLLASPDAVMRLAALRAIGELGDDSDLPKLSELASRSERLTAGGRGFGFAPAVDLAFAARNAIRMIEGRRGSR